MDEAPRRGPEACGLRDVAGGGKSKIKTQKAQLQSKMQRLRDCHRDHRGQAPRAPGGETTDSRQETGPKGPPQGTLEAWWADRGRGRAKGGLGGLIGPSTSLRVEQSSSFWGDFEGDWGRLGGFFN